MGRAVSERAELLVGPRLCATFHGMEDRYKTEPPLIAIVDDEESVRTTVAYALKKEGYRVRTFRDGADALAGFSDGLPDMAVIDIIMPRLDGLELCRKIRARSETIPIIFLTSKDEEIDRIVGLEIGADDYLCKPFSMRELCTRIKVIFRRASFYNEALRDGSLRDAAGPLTTREPAVTGPLMLDPERLTVSWMGKPVRLTVTEFRILASLAEKPGTVKNRDQLLIAENPEDLYVSDRSVNSHIKGIRKKIQQADPDFSCIESIYGLGYKFAVQE